MNAEELKLLVNNPDYHNRFDPKKNWDRIAHISGRPIQAAEANELQHILEEKIRALGYAQYVDGTVIEGCEIALDKEIRVARMTGGRIFVGGLVREVQSASLNIPDAETVQVGIWLKSRNVTAAEDATLLNPAVNTPMYRMEGGSRIVTTAEWGLNLDGLSRPFYPLYTVSGGEIVSQIVKEKNLDYLDALARYDRDSHGHYVVEGLHVTALPNADAEDDGVKQTYSISQGLAHIHGYEARLPHSVRLVVDEKPDLYNVTSEAHLFEGDGTGKMVLDVNHYPIENIGAVKVTKERTVNLTHGGYTGCSDNLPDTSVIKIVQVKQGAKIFVPGPDYRLGADVVDWAPSGDEPAPGSQYEATYQYRTNVVPENVTGGTIDLSGLVEGSLIELDYTYRLPRKDIVVMYRDRSITLIKGIAHRYAPVVPDTPPGAIRLAEVEQNWSGLPVVKNVAVVTLRMDTLQEMRRSQRDQYSLLSELRMQFDAMISAPSSSYGVFVDPLFDDDMRDKGTPQTARIAGQELLLPIDTDVVQLPSELHTMNYSPDLLIDQPKKTKCMNINPYMAFEPLPALVSLNPAIDRWTETFTSWVSSTSSRTVSTLEEDAAGTLRGIPIEIAASEFGPNEPIQVIFDGLVVVCTSNRADGEGKFQGRITIPAGIPTGTKLVRLQGSHTQGSATFVGMRNVRTVINYVAPPPPEDNDFPGPDPLAQTFTLSTSRHVAGVDFFLCKKGTSPIRIEIRETALGFPNQTTVAFCQLRPSQLNEGSFNRAFFDIPALLTAGIEYALVVMTDTADHEVGIAELGDWDPETGWVTSQPFQAGVLLSSSNASTWTPHQSMDLTFRLFGALFDATEAKKVPLGEYDLTGVTDVLTLAGVQRTSADTDVTFVLTKDDVEVARMQAGQILSFDAPLSGAHLMRAELFGNRYFSPILGRDPQLVTGKIRTTGDYVGRMFRFRPAKKIMVTLEALTPGTSTVEVYVQVAGSWVQATLEENEPVGNGWFRQHYFVTANLTETKIRIDLAGDAASRPRVREISGVALSV